MKHPSQKYIIRLIIITILLVSGWFWYGQYMQQKSLSSQNNETAIVQPIMTQNDETVPSDNTQEQPMVWYDIPELGIRFPVSQEIKDELVYKAIPLSGEVKQGEHGKTALVSFSTKTLALISKHCSAEDGPLGAISRRVGKPDDPRVPCGGGQKVKEFKGGYFCYTHAQSLCMSGEEYDQNKALLKQGPSAKIFQKNEFWDSVEIIH